MSLDREAIYSALFSRLQNVTGFVTVSRLWKHWDDSLEQPALYLMHGNERPEQQRGMPPAWTLTPSVYVYVRSQEGDPSQSPSIKLNTLIKAVEEVFERTDSDTMPYGGPEEWGNTLGGLVDYCR